MRQAPTSAAESSKKIRQVIRQNNDRFNDERHSIRSSSAISDNASSYAACGNKSFHQMTDAGNRRTHHNCERATIKSLPRLLRRTHAAFANYRYGQSPRQSFKQI